jgi:hypothetical protein
MSQRSTNLEECRLLSERDGGDMATESKVDSFHIGQTDMQIDTKSILTGGSYKCASNVQELGVLVNDAK